MLYALTILPPENMMMPKKTICLDQAATSSPKPKCVAQTVSDYLLRNASNVNRGSYRSAEEASDVVFDTRQALCSLFEGDDPSLCIFTANITASLNMLLKGLLRSGDHVLVSSMEHHAVMRPLVQLTARGVSFDRIPCDETGRMRLECLPSLLRPHTRAIVCLHASNVNGALMPLEQLGDFCRANGLDFIVDSAQSAGRLPISMREMKISALAFTGHKSLFGPQGIGGFLLTEKLADQMEPLLAGGTGSFSHLEQMPELTPDKFEAGTLNLPGIYGLHASLEWLAHTGMHTILRRERDLCAQLEEGLAEIPGIRIVPHPPSGEMMPLLSVSGSGVLPDIAMAAAILDEKYGIQTRTGLHCAPAAHRTLHTFPEGTLRFSPGWFSTEEEIAFCIEAMKEICHGYETA